MSGTWNSLQGLALFLAILVFVGLGFFFRNRAFDRILPDAGNNRATASSSVEDHNNNLGSAEPERDEALGAPINSIKKDSTNSSPPELAGDQVGAGQAARKDEVVESNLNSTDPVVNSPSEKIDVQRTWPQWRGPLGTGVAPKADPAIEWSETKNIRWKISIPGKGHSTPVVWGDHIYLTTAIPHGEKVAPPAGPRPGAHDNQKKVRSQKFVVLAVNRKDGKVAWQKTVHDAVPHEGTHDTGSFSSPSPVTDGEHIIASFGSMGIFGLDMKGNIVWKRDLGDMRSKHGHGEGVSPALHGETVIVNWDHEGPSFVVALDKRTGEVRWKKARDEVTSWSTPLIVVDEGKPQVIISATTRVRSYDLQNGKVLWECGGMSNNVVATPVAADGVVYLGCSYEKRLMMAIRFAGARGDLTDTDRVLWKLTRNTPYVPSPLLYEGKLYFLKHYQPILSCVDVKTGRIIYGPGRLSGLRSIYASLMGAAGRIYITSLNGATLVLKHGDEPEFLGLNQLDDSFNASPVAVDDELYLRGVKHLYCIVAK